MNQKLFLITGQFSLIIGLAGFLFNYFLGGNDRVVAFVVGIFLGLSLVMNAACLVKRKKHPEIK